MFRSMDGCQETCHRDVRVNTAINAQTSYALGSVCLYSVDCTLEPFALGAAVGSGKGKATGEKKLFLMMERGDDHRGTMSTAKKIKPNLSPRL